MYTIITLLTSVKKSSALNKAPSQSDVVSHITVLPVT